MIALSVEFNTEHKCSGLLRVANRQVDEVATDSNLWHNIIAIRLQDCSNCGLMFV